MQPIEFETQDREKVANFLKRRGTDAGVFINEMHRRWCPVETASGQPFCLCKPTYRVVAPLRPRQRVPA